jgi:small subunit ribosomal protein S1
MRQPGAALGMRSVLGRIRASDLFEQVMAQVLYFSRPIFTGQSLSGGDANYMTQDQGAQTPVASASEDTVPDGSGGVVARTAASTSGETYAGDDIVLNDVGESQEDLMAAIEATIKPFGEGDIVEGVVVKIDKDETLVDIGYKSEGVIPARELSIRNDVDPREVIDIGEEIEALVLQKEDADGRLILSKKRAQYERAWGKIEGIKNQDGTVRGPVIEVVKGGLILDIGLRGFLPASLVEMRRVRDLQPYVGQELECRIIELDKNRNNVVLSRRKFLEESQAEQRQEFLTGLNKGEVRKGTVSSIVNFGAFVDLGGVDGLVHVSELSWKHVDHPSEVVEVGQEVDVEILDVDLDRERVSLSLKATQEDPWRQFARSHEVGDIIEGRATKLVPFGAFVELDDAIEGLVHISELAEHHVEKPDDEVRVHDRIPVKIIDIDLDRRRISLSRKQAIAEGGIPGESEMELEVEAREASESAGVPTEDTIERPESEAELRSAVEEEPELATESITPGAGEPEAVGQAAPPEEREEAELESEMAPDHNPEGRQNLTASESDQPNMEERLLDEDSDNQPGTAVDEIVADESPQPLTERGEEERAAAATGRAEGPTEAKGGPDSAGDGDEESIESIVEDLKRERGQ